MLADGGLPGGQRVAELHVALELVAKRRERERLEQVQGDPVGDGGAHHRQVAGRGDGDDVGTRVQAAQRRGDVEAAGVGQADVEQDQVDRFAAADGGGGGAHGRVPGVHHRVHRETRHPFDIRLVRLGDQRLVLDDQDADHGAPGSSRGDSGIRTTSIEPSDGSVRSVPWCRVTTWDTRASPSPRCPDLVEYPRVRARSTASDDMSGPLSATLSTIIESSSRTVTSTQGSVVARAASMALSTRLPTSVTSSRRDRAVTGPSAVSSVTVRSTPRSAASPTLPSSNAASAGSC